MEGIYLRAQDKQLKPGYIAPKYDFHGYSEKYGAFGNVRRIQKERYGNRLIASDLANPDFVAFGKSFGAEAERVHTPDELRRALRRAFAHRDGLHGMKREYTEVGKSV